ncbi:hypothetical protein [Arthrobacter roseus]|uniref:hypothetical protein n=1 Tax=Arthrobacter roseus TaxID=136274 RepID=UPI0019628EEE|nr:hypothetical protein [Arthrobacter roseus]MBM7848104.1 hypothetical protein [Arthrobacter roseus]
MRSARKYRLSRTQFTLAVVGFIVLSAGLWWGWFAWDNQYVVDPVTGSSSGPYELWQVIGCAASWIVLGWIGNKLLQPLLVIIIMPAAFTTAFAITAARMDDSGLWPVGAILMALGTLAGTAVLVAILNWRLGMTGKRTK